MKVYKILKTAIILFAVANSSYCFAQADNASDTRKADSLLKEINNTIYNRISSPYFWKDCNIPTSTILMVSINKKGEVTGIDFSDSADSLFVKTYLGMPKYHDDRMTLQRYAKVKGYKYVSLFFPINFEPMFDKSKGCYTYKETEKLFQFNKTIFTGKAIMMKAIRIRVSSESNSRIKRAVLNNSLT